VAAAQQWVEQVRGLEVVGAQQVLSLLDGQEVEAGHDL
jgi:hypothetical protein